MSRRPRPLAVLLLAVAAALLLSACRVSSEVAIRVDDDGSGQVSLTVRLDPEAARRLGDPATALRTDDLTAAGWVVEPPEVADDGALKLLARRDFASPQELPVVLDEVGGTDGVFRDVSLTITDGFATTEYDLARSGGADRWCRAVRRRRPDRGPGWAPLARTPEELALEGGADPEAMTLRVVVELPGGTPDTDGVVEEGAATWSFPVTGGEPTSASISSTSTVQQQLPRALVLVALLSLIVALGLGGFALIRRNA